MILNAFALVDGFVCLARLVVACGLAALALAAWRSKTSGPSAALGAFSENRRTLVILLAAVLAGLNIVAWPLLYSVLQSYVPYWPGVMCIYGVTRIGEGSEGPSRWLPTILTTLQLIKPAIVFLSGGWLVAYIADRASPTKLPGGRWLGLVVAMSTLSIADAGLELTYLAIPKAERFLEVGCCVTAADSGASGRGLVPLAAESVRQVGLAHFALSAIFAAAIAALLARERPVDFRAAAVLVVTAAALVPIATAFLCYVAAPALLHLPYHPCAYCLLRTAPESVLGIGSFLIGTFCVGWLALLHWSSLGGGPLAYRLLVIALFGYLGSLALFSAELLCA
jgi:hypothetical protein